MRGAWVALAMILLAGWASGARAEATLRCEMKFTLSSWSFLYRSAKGEGTIRCADGQTVPVRLRAQGGGLTAGKTTIDDGHGEFSAVNHVDELLGSYASAEAHAGAVRSADGNLLTKGPVSLALGGTGRGWDLGLSLGRLKIERR